MILSSFFEDLNVLGYLADIAVGSRKNNVDLVASRIERNGNRGFWCALLVWDIRKLGTLKSDAIQADICEQLLYLI